MKKILVAIISLAIVLPISVYGIGEWSDWWDIGETNSVRRIYDHENKLVCWIVAGPTYNSASGKGIDCEPSLELGNPLYSKL